jgi:hypothetical protein
MRVEHRARAVDDFELARQALRPAALARAEARRARGGRIGEKETCSRRGSRDAQLGRQNTPVVRTA